MKENGYNAIRSAHNPCSKAMLEACDRQGMLMMDEYIDHWYIHKTMHDYVEFFEEFWRQDMADMVDKDYNHPCVILYSTGNEVAETAQPRGIALAKEMTDFLHELDSSRPVSCGINIFFNFLNAIGMGQYSDEKAAKEAARAAKAKAEGKKVKESATGSKFFNDMAGLLGADFMKLGATLHGSDVTTRAAFANMDIAGYNYGEKRYQKDLKKYPDRLILGSETFCSDAYKFWELAKENPRLIGDFVWSGFDYLGEDGIGAWEYKEYAPEFEHNVGWITAGAGRIDLTGKPLGEALYTKVAFELEQGPLIAVRPICHAESSHSPSAWKMTAQLVVPRLGRQTGSCGGLRPSRRSGAAAEWHQCRQKADEEQLCVFLLGSLPERQTGSRFLSRIRQGDWTLPAGNRRRRNNFAGCTRGNHRKTRPAELCPLAVYRQEGHCEARRAGNSGSQRPGRQAGGLGLCLSLL